MALLHILAHTPDAIPGDIECDLHGNMIYPHDAIEPEAILVDLRKDVGTAILVSKLLTAYGNGRQAGLKTSDTGCTEEGW